MVFLFAPTYHSGLEHSTSCCHRGVNVHWERRNAAICRTLLETASFVFQNARLFVFANVNICKSRCWAPSDWGPPKGLEEALFTCSEECCPARTLLYLSGTQGHSAGRDGPLCPSPSFHLTISTTKHNVSDLREGNGIPAHVATVFRNSGSMASFYLW